MKENDSIRSNPKKPGAEELLPLHFDAANEEWLSIQELMVYFKLSRRSINRLMEQNLIPNVKLGGTVMFPKKLTSTIMIQLALKEVKGNASDTPNTEE